MGAQLIELMREGASKAEVCAALGISFETLSVWRENRPEFSEALKAGERLSQAWWERLGREAASGARKIDAAVWIFNMKNRFGWRDRRETEHTVKGSLDVLLDEVGEALEASPLGHIRDDA